MPVTSSDTNYNGADPQDMAFTNLDDDSSTSSSAGGGFLITPPDNATTTASGDNATFSIKLATAPTSDVYLPIYVSDNTEALIMQSGSADKLDNLTLVFTPSTYSDAQIITIVGQRDFAPEGDTSFSVILMPSISVDTQYNGVNPQDLSFVNINDDRIYLFDYGTPVDGQFSTISASDAKDQADAMCSTRLAQLGKSDYSGFAMLTFGSNLEIRDLPTNENFSEKRPVYGNFDNSKLISYSWLGLASAKLNLNSAGLFSTNTYYWTFSNSFGSFSSESCSGGTSATNDSSDNAHQGYRSESNNSNIFYSSKNRTCNNTHTFICGAFK